MILVTTSKFSHLSYHWIYSNPSSCVDEKLYQVGFGPNFEPTTEEDSTYIENYQPIAPSGTFEPIEVESTSTNESVEAALNSNSTKPVEFAPFGNSTKPVEFAPFGNGTKSVGVEPFSNGTFQDTADPKSVEVESPVYLDASYRTVGSNETVAIQAPVAVSEDGDALFGNGTVYHV